MFLTEKNDDCSRLNSCSMYSMKSAMSFLENANVW